jgi:hypothetical protein
MHSCVGSVSNSYFFVAGGEGEFTKAEEDGDDVVETKWDQFWNFPSIENEHSFDSFKQFKDTALMPMLLGFKKLAIAKGLAKDKDEIKDKGLRMATNGFKFIQTNFDTIQFFSTESVVIDGSEVGGGAVSSPSDAMDTYTHFLPVFLLCRMRRMHQTSPC